MLCGIPLVKKDQTVCNASCHVRSIPSHHVLLSALACRRRLNNPSAHTFCDNCNVLLSAAMDKAGSSEYCDASEEVQKLLPHLIPRAVWSSHARSSPLASLALMPCT